MPHAVPGAFSISDGSEEITMTNTITTHNISYEAASLAVAIAMEIAAAKGVRPVVTVMNTALTTVAYGMADHATPHSVETSARKARTAASTKNPSGSIGEPIKLIFPLATGNAITSIPGGVPIAFDGVHVGGIGVAGGSPQDDLDIAIETLARLGADPLAN